MKNKKSFFEELPQYLYDQKIEIEGRSKLRKDIAKCVPDIVSKNSFISTLAVMGVSIFVQSMIKGNDEQSQEKKRKIRKLTVDITQGISYKKRGLY